MRKSKKSSSKFNVEYGDVELARVKLSEFLQPTPLIYNKWLSQKFGCHLYLKLENMQPIGSFKLRGATYKISTMTPAQRRKGVICASAGNHAQGVAWGAQHFKTKALIIMPINAPLVKIENTKKLGAEVRLHGDSYDEAFAYAKRLAKKEGKTFVHAYEDPDVIAGQGTIGLEILDQLPDVDFILGSVGGGGMVAGIGIAVKKVNPKIKVIGCQAKGAPSFFEAFKKGKSVQLKSVSTFADGIKVKRTSPAMYGVLKKVVDQVLVAREEEIAAGVLGLVEKAKILSEGAGALPYAVLGQIKKAVRGKKVVLVVSGGNIDVNVLARILDRGLVEMGRRLRINVMVSDLPGSLAAITKEIANEGANVLQAVHDRDRPSGNISNTEIELTLETRGQEHSEAIIRKLRKLAAHVEFVI
jgi:threonine dehydratase